MMMTMIMTAVTEDIIHEIPVWVRLSHITSHVRVNSVMGKYSIKELE